MRVTMYLLRSETKLSKEILRRRHLYRERPLRPPSHDDMTWRLFVNPGMEKDARWFEHIQPLLSTSDGRHAIRSRSAGAVLLVKTHGRIFAITFGTGFHAVDPSLTEPDFGLKVAANSVDPDRITLADARGLGKGRRNATSRLPTPNEVFALGLLTDEEWIRKFGGQVKLPGFAKSVSGADSLQLNIEDFSLFDLPDKLRQALDLYGSNEYLQAFPFLDYFRRETDKAKIALLDELLADCMRKRDLEIGFALPDEYNLTADGYVLSRYRRQTPLTELRTEDVYAAIDHLDGWRYPLKQVKVDAYDLADATLLESVPLRSYAVATVRPQIDGQSQDYAVTAGAWFRIDQEYVHLVDHYIKDNVADITDELRLPAWDDEFLKHNVDGRYGEDRYNKWVGRERGFAVLDQDLYRGRAGERVEICDLLTADKKLICVKRMDGSDKMSHLFQQGSVSTRMLMVNDEYRAKLMTKLRKLDPSAEFGSPTDWTVVYAIATSKPGDLKKIMYFFSRAALRMHGESIKGCGFKVAIAKIHKVAPTSEHVGARPPGEAGRDDVTG